MRPSFFLPLIAVLLSGCGGAGGAGPSGGQYAGDYVGTIPITATRSGEVRLRVDGTSVADGTFTVAGDPPADGEIAIPAGVYRILGSAGVGGGFSAQGLYNGTNRFVVGGNLPTRTSQGRLVLSASGRSAVGTWSGGGDPGPIGNGITFAGTAGSNVSGTFPSVNRVNVSVLGQQVNFVVTPSETDRTKVLEGFTNLAPGATASVGGNNMMQATVRYEEGTNGWNGLGGTVRLVSVSPYILQLNEVVMIPDPTSGAQGTFRISGTIRG